MKLNDWNLITFGFVMGGVSGGVLDAALPFNSKAFVGSDGRIQWETLLTGLGAVVAAFFTVVKLRQQIDQTQKLANDQRRRRARSARAALPLALSQLAEYATSCIVEMHDLRLFFQPDGSIDRSRGEEIFAAWTLPPLAENILSVLKECIESVEDEPAQAIVELIRHLQIQRARLADYISRKAYASASGDAISGGTASEYGVEQISNISRFGRLP
jgi:hypothetical protein